MTRAAIAQIDLSALRHNVQQARALSAGAQCVAVIKANAYGHGLVPIARALQSQIDALAVVSMDEAEALRDAGIQGPLLLLQGCASLLEWKLAQQLGLDCVIHCTEQLASLSKLQDGNPLNIWLKINTGMNRLGFAAQDVSAAVEQLKAHGWVNDWVLMSHFANADNPDDSLTEHQLQRFSEAIDENAAASSSIANSAGLIHWTNSHYQWVRPGIMLYGISPLRDVAAETLSIKPVMTLSADIIAIYALAAGEAVGYGQIWRAKRDTRYAVISIGYGDGYPRLAPSGTPVLIAGHRAGIIGRVSMDSILVDITDIPDELVHIGDAVTLWGKGLPVEEVAAAIGTIGYELVASLSPRIQYDYLG